MEKAVPCLASPEYQHASKAPQKGPARQYKWEIPATWMDISQWRKTSNAQEHLEFCAHRILSLPFTWPNTLLLQGPVREEQPWQDLNLAAVQIPVREKRRSLWAKTQLSLNQPFWSEGHREEKMMLEEERVCYTCSIPDQLSNPQ